MPAGPVMRVVQPESGGVNRLRNADFEQATASQFTAWSAAPQGCIVAPGEGRANSQSLACNAADAQGWQGASQTLALNRTNILPVAVRGWSRAENVSGSADSDYSLYVDIVYRDGTPLWGQTGNFSAGTHDWEQRQFVILPEKPIQSLTIYCLFRNHSGKVWFDDLSVAEVSAPAGAFLFQGTPLAIAASNAPPAGPTTTFRTGDQLQLKLTGERVTGLSIADRELAGSAPSGFLARDMAARSDLFAFENGACPELNLTLNTTITSQSDHLVFEGSVTDTTGGDRAVMLLFALPLDTTGWNWGQNIHQSRVIAAPDELSATVAAGGGANGQQALYPMACVSDARSGLAIAVDMAKPAQFRLAYHAGTKQLFVVYDLGLVKDTTGSPSSAGFRFVLYRFDPRWGFRGAWEKYTRLFADHFAVRSKEQGIWMPFTDVSTVSGWQDFGFRYHEGNNNVAFDDQHGILSFRYTEPMTWWMNMDAALPRTIAAALQARDTAATGPAGQAQTMALITRSAAMWDASGQPSLQFRDEPWANGAVWSLNPNPNLPVNPNAATVYWNDAIRQSLYGPAAASTLDGEYLDSLEGYVTAELNFRRDHFAPSTVPLTFDPETGRPALWKGLAVAEFTRWISDDLHRIGKLCFANGVPYRFSFLCPWLDVMGTETDWLSSGQYRPATHAQMALWRTLAGQKPYLLLMNTDFNTFTTNLVERYFQRSLLYGMYPSMFSYNAAENPYWQNPAWYNRDRSLFLRYQPVIKEVAQAGWQPVTRAGCDNTNLLVERFGPAADGADYFTVFNDSANAQTTRLSASLADPQTQRAAFEMLSGARLAPDSAGWYLRLEPQACVAIKVLPQAKFLKATRDPAGALRFSVLAPLGSAQTLEVSDNLTSWLPVSTNAIVEQPQDWLVPAPENAAQFYRLRW
jgi:hypothetical protein